MKSLYVMFLLLLVAGSAAAQSSSSTPDAPDVLVVENSWRKLERNPKLEEDPLAVSQQQVNLERAQREVIRENAARARADLPQRPMPTRGAMPVKNMPVGPWVEYVYEVKVSNTGTKTIRKLYWEYVFSTPGSQPKAGRRQFISKSRILPGKSKKLTERSPFPPLGVIDATQTGDNPQGQASERVLIQRIEYADGSVWTRDSE